MLNKHEVRMVNLSIYHNGQYRVIPLITGFVVVGQRGEMLDRFKVDQISLAVETVDQMAELDGCFEAVA